VYMHPEPYIVLPLSMGSNSQSMYVTLPHVYVINMGQVKIL